MSIPFYKYHALGNDYLVMDPNRATFVLTPTIVQNICHRNFGIGSDGILLGPILDPETGSMRLRIFNPDGSEAEKSGNGIRIFSRYLKDAGYVSGDQPFNLFTLGGTVIVDFLPPPSDLIKVDMGRATFISNEIPVSGPTREVVNEPLEILGTTYTVSCVSVGNPHCVIPLADISSELAHKIGPHVETHPQFPNKINMQLLKVIDRNTIQIEIWERGAGYTLASGSSSCAAASVARKLGQVDQRVTVNMPGGTLHISFAEDGHIDMIGPVTAVATGLLDNQLLQKAHANEAAL